TEPKVGTFTEFVFDDRTLRIYRMPSSSRAYPMRPERKAEYYDTVFRWLGMKE
ncbi:MAG: uracil-DNA glycosylase family protein, partial [Prevotella sp.]